MAIALIVKMRATKIPPPPSPESVNNTRTSFVYPAGFTQVFCEYSSLPRAVSPVQRPQDWGGHQALTCPEWSQRAVSPQRFPSSNRGSFVKLTLRAVFPPGLVVSFFWDYTYIKKNEDFSFYAKANCGSVFPQNYPTPAPVPGCQMPLQ